MALTARDHEIIVLAMQSVKSGDIQIDYQKLAELGGFKNTASASAVWYAVRKKLFNTVSSGATSSSPLSTATPTTPGSRKRKTNAAAEPNSGTTEGTTLTTAEASVKTPTKAPAKRRKAEGDDAAAEDSTSKAKTPRKRATPKAKNSAQNIKQEELQPDAAAGGQNEVVSQTVAEETKESANNTIKLEDDEGLDDITLDGNDRDQETV